MKSSKETQMKLKQKTVLLTVGAVAVVAIVAGGILMWNNHKKNQSMVPVETMETHGTDVFGMPIDSYVGDVGTIKYDMSAYDSLDSVMAQITNLEYRTPVGNVVIVDSGRYADDEIAAQAMRAIFGEDVNQESTYYVHVRLIQTSTDNPSWVNNNVNQNLITLINFDSTMTDGISHVVTDFRPAYVDDLGNWTIATDPLEDGQMRDVYYIACLDQVDTTNGELTIAVGPNDEIGLTYYVYSMTYGNVEGLNPEELNPQSEAVVETVGETVAE